MAQAGRILMTRADGTIALDTNGRLFQGTDRLRGSVAIPARAATCNNGNFANVNLDRDQFIANVNQSADTVVGSFRVVSSSSFGVANLGWFNASGSYLHYQYAASDYSAGLAFYTFKAGNGQLVLNERVQLKAALSSSSGVTTKHTLVACTIQFNLFVGSLV